MGFFVQQKNNPSQENNSEPISDRLDLNLILNAKQLGLSFEELNELRVTDFIEMVDIKTGNGNNGPKKATQEDIDKLFS
ncbi:MAG: hypothetical protein K9L56_15535 [Clostridiales bacterium]|nr:hypothetical protein [Clostridiales bacterium]